MQFAIQWNLNLGKPYYTKNWQYEMGLEKIFISFNEKIFKMQKRKLKFADSKDKVLYS